MESLKTRLCGEDGDAKTKQSIVLTPSALIPAQALALAHCHYTRNAPVSQQKKNLTSTVIIRGRFSATKHIVSEIQLANSLNEGPGSS